MLTFIFGVVACLAVLVVLGTIKTARIEAKRRAQFPPDRPDRQGG